MKYTNIFIYNGRIVLIRPKMLLADDGNYREARWFTPWPINKFEEFWNSYPRKIAKADAVKAWKKAIKRKSPEDLIRLAKVYTEGKLPEMTYIPYPASWLNKELYDNLEREQPKELPKPIFGRIK